MPQTRCKVAGIAEAGKELQAPTARQEQQEREKRKEHETQKEAECANPCGAWRVQMSCSSRFMSAGVV